MKKIIIVLLFYFNTIEVFSQRDSIVFSREVDMKDGIYLTIEQFKTNDPILKSNIVDLKTNLIDYIPNWKPNNVISYIDSSGREINVRQERIWGFCQNKTIYYNNHGSFCRLPVVGSLCHFVDQYKSTYYEPLSNEMGYSNYPVYRYEETALRQIVLDISTGKTHEFNVENMELLLKKDEVLYKEFMALKRKRKKNSIFIYLLKYNEAHPLYIPLR
jgi:hypothetical protein